MASRIGIGVLLLCLLGPGLWLLHRHFAAGEETSFLRWEEPRAVHAGEALYRAHCAACHGVPGISDPVMQAGAREPPPPHDESGHTWQHPDFALFQLIRDGVAVANCDPVDPQRMPMFRDVLDDAELVAVLSYIKSRWPAHIRAEHDKVNVMYAPYNRAVAKLIDAAD